MRSRQHSYLKGASAILHSRGAGARVRRMEAYLRSRIGAGYPSDAANCTNSRQAALHEVHNRKQWNFEKNIQFSQPKMHEDEYHRDPVKMENILEVNILQDVSIESRLMIPCSKSRRDQLFFYYDLYANYSIYNMKRNTLDHI